MTPAYDAPPQGVGTPVARRVANPVVAAVIACYRDAEAVREMHARLTAAFTEASVEYRIVFVNDRSPDDAADRILELSARDPRVIGITHSRNFGSQAAFLSGMSAVDADAYVLLDGDLQDPPEMIPSFIALWRMGWDVVYGRRVNRDTSWLMNRAYRMFYRLFRWASPFEIPRDAGDFSLMDARVVQAVVSFPERDLFLRGLRAYVGFRQVGVDYVRPERPYGRSTNSIVRNIGWATTGILSVSRVPLRFLTGTSIVLGLAALLLLVVQLFLKLFAPGIAPPGTVTILGAIILLGSLNLLAVGVLGEYLGRVFDEVKRRPRFIRESVIRDGRVESLDNTAGDELQGFGASSNGDSDESGVM